MNNIRTHLFKYPFETENPSELLNYLKTLDTKISSTKDNLIILCDTSNFPQENPVIEEVTSGEPVGSYDNTQVANPQYILFISKKNNGVTSGDPVGSFDLSNYFWPTKKRLTLDNPNTNEGLWPKMWMKDINTFINSDTRKSQIGLNENSTLEDLEYILRHEMDDNFDLYIETEDNKSLATLLSEHQNDLSHHSGLTLADLIENNPDPDYHGINI